MNEINLELLQAMVQRVLDGQAAAREDASSIKKEITALRHRVGRAELAVLAMARGQAAQQVQLDAHADRLDRLERRP